MKPALFITVLVLTVAPMGVGQKQSARGSHRASVEETIRKLDNERIQAQIHADATALDRIYAADFIGVGPAHRRDVRLATKIVRLRSPSPPKPDYSCSTGKVSPEKIRSQLRVCRRPHVERSRAASPS
jgi:hypothetical protein